MDLRVTSLHVCSEPHQAMLSSYLAGAHSDSAGLAKVCGDVVIDWQELLRRGHLRPEWLLRTWRAATQPPFQARVIRTGSSLMRWSMVAAISVTDICAKVAPRHMRGPAPKGTH